MFCKKCGTELRTGAKFCPKCGCPVSEQAINTEKFYNTRNRYYDNEFAPKGTNIHSELPMNWYKFVIWAFLFLMSILLLVIAIQAFRTGALYMEGAWFNSAYRSVGVMFIVFGIIYICLIVFALYVRQQLAQYRKNSPAKLLVWIIIVAICNAIYTTANGTAAMEGAGVIISGILGACLYVPLNYIYFKKRESMFCN